MAEILGQLNKPELVKHSNGEEYEVVKIIDLDALFKLKEIPENKKDYPTRELKFFHSENPKRLQDETFEEYKHRQYINNKINKFKKRGIIHWNSTEYKTFKHEDSKRRESNG